MTICSNCGAEVSRRDTACSYCQRENPDYAPPDAEVNRLLEQGMQAFQGERHAQAIECYSQIIKLDPDVFGAYFYLAASLTSLGRRAGAIEAMKKAHALRPGNAAAIVNLGILSKQEGNKAEARLYLQKALKLLEEDSGVSNREQLRQHVKKELASLD